MSLAPSSRRALVLLGVLVLVGGLALWIISVAAVDAARAWRALLIAFLLFTPLALSLVVWPAVVFCSNARWSAPVDPLALGGISFALPSLLLYALLWAGHRSWAPWTRLGHLPQGAWLNPTFVLARDGFFLAALWLLAWVFVRRYRQGRHSLALSGSLVLSYCLVFSLLGFDLVMALDPYWYSSLFGGYFFITGMYSGVIAWAVLTAVAQPRRTPELQDLGRLLVTFCLLSTYLMFAQLLLIWYENLPAEIRYVIPRAYQQPWRTISFILLGVLYLGPLVLLLPGAAKRSPWYSGTVSLLLLVAMWIERWWLVTPTLRGPFAVGLPELSISFALAAALGLGIAWHVRRTPARTP